MYPFEKKKWQNFSAIFYENTISLNSFCLAVGFDSLFSFLPSFATHFMVGLGEFWVLWFLKPCRTFSQLKQRKLIYHTNYLLEVGLKGGFFLTLALWHAVWNRVTHVDISFRRVGSVSRYGMLEQAFRYPRKPQSCSFLC